MLDKITCAELDYCLALGVYVASFSPLIGRDKTSSAFLEISVYLRAKMTSDSCNVVDECPITEAIVKVCFISPPASCFQNSTVMQNGTS